MFLTSSIRLSKVGADHFLVSEHGCRRSFRDHATGIHYDATVAERADHIHHVLDDDDRQPFFAQNFYQRDADLQFGRIETGEPLIEEEKDRQIGRASWRERE